MKIASTSLILLPILVAVFYVTLVFKVANTVVVVSKQGLQNLSQPEVELVATRNFVPVVV